MKKYILLMLLLASNVIMLNAQERDDDFKKFQARIDVATYNALDFGMEYGISYSPIRYVGVSASLCVASDFKSTSLSYVKDGLVYETNEMHDGCWLRGGIQLRTPILWRSSNGKLKLSVQEECGATIPLPVDKTVDCEPTPSSSFGTDMNVERVKNQGGEWIYFHSKTSVLLDIKRWQVSAGYTWSNMDVYSSTRNASERLGLKLPAKKNLYGFHIGVGYSF